MNKLKLSQKRKKHLLILIQQLLSVLIAINVCMVFADSVITVNGFNGSKSYVVAKGKDFEDTKVFGELFRTSVDDIVRMSVIKQQLETEGEFDGGKPIDITQYARRKNSSAGHEITAVYYLGDLIKWYSYGVDSQLLYFEEEKDADAYFSGDRSGVLQDAEGGNDVVLELLQCRYPTVDGHKLEEIAGNAEEYRQLTENLKSTLRSIGNNYEEYKQFQRLYEEGESNVFYCMELNRDEQTERMSNIEALDGNGTYRRELIQSWFNEYDKWLCYERKDIVFDTNIDIDEYYMFDALKKYDYVFPEDTRIWIGVDTEYEANDRFSQGKEAFNKAAVNSVRILCSLFCVAAYLAILVVLTIKAGRGKQEEGEENQVSLWMLDHLHTEMVVIFAAAMTELWWIIYRWLEKIGRYMGDWQDGKVMYMLLFAGIMAFVGNGIFLLLYYSLVRRIKARNLWKESFSYYIWQGLKTVGRSLLASYRNTSITVQSWSSYLAFLTINFFGLLVIYVMVGNHYDYIGGLMFVILVVFDLWIGYRRFVYHRERRVIQDTMKQMREGNMFCELQAEEMHGDNKAVAEIVNNIGDGIRSAVAVSMKDEKLKADLITNVSHDIKTPLTSIISYVDLLKRENIQDEKIAGYIQVLDVKSQRLKQLTEDLVEASKISSGNISLVLEVINFIELLKQAEGEFSEKFESKGLTMVSNYGTPVAMIMADSRQLWRVIENLFNNIYKYAMEGTRVYLNAELEEDKNNKRWISVSIKNISKQSLNIQADELTERFVRGDVSRSSEGSGLGLSIARNLTEAHKGTFDIYLDGDLFKVTLGFEVVTEE